MGHFSNSGTALPVKYPEVAFKVWIKYRVATKKVPLCRRLYLLQCTKNHSKGYAVFQIKVFIIALLACISLQVHADPVMDFYSGFVPVNDRSQLSFQQGMNDALLQVLVKVSAEQPEKLKQNPNLLEALSGAERFAAQFLYKTQADLQPGGASKNQLYLQATFPEKIIMGLLKKANVRFWSAQRPQVLVLPVVNVGGLAHMANISNKKIDETLAKASQQYGIPVKTGGENQEDAALLWNTDVTYINKMAAAAGTKIALVVQMADNNGSKGKWILVDGAEVSKLDVNMDTPANFANKGFAWVANVLAAKQAVELTSAASKLDLLVSGIDTYQRYEDATTYLKTISIVEQLSVTKIQPGFMNATLQLTTGVDQLEKMFQVDKKIEIKVDQAGQKSYHWNE